MVFVPDPNFLPPVPRTFGSNSSLFPLPMTSDKNFDINHLMRNFPYDQYMWTIGTAYGVELLTDTTLHIKPIEQNDSPSAAIKCRLHIDIKPLEFDLPYVRFSLDRESITILMETDGVLLSKPDKETLLKT
ncbi:unnamed protein product [Didymodactylos carnosus]|uniref:Uncharacterized protein n=1 Tax=Didymodactylos carnosus TaxID=1234261 RepID=A0A813YPQ4_9BILA|nr:unnamed protein product [Didymodactylos carnosus]CAF1447963.1 unnamed protein product [Didymodactylos carnosus]CAF3672257.1 unnamed protein product [Didymodactylos carnosus]CAF4243177.1 unnamed protein product [Didymodactylos carnosus]